MNPSMRPPPSLIRIVARVALLLAPVLAGCASKVADPNAAAFSGNGSTVPVASRLQPDSPQHLVQAFVGAVSHRDIDTYRTLFTDDYEFVFATSDSAGNVYVGRRMMRLDEIETANHLFVTGTANEPPATRILLTISGTSIPEPDSRPGKTYPFHQEIKLDFVLSVDTVTEFYRISGALRFFIVRGDSAAIPPDLAARGFHPDPSRWWIERWEDESVELPGAPSDAPTPTRVTTWGALKSLYR